MAEQSTTMVLKVDLECCKCYKKVKKVLCEIPEIRDQVYDFKQNIVTIKVVCCCAETLKQKILCKAGKCITSIDIKKEPKKNGKCTDGENKSCDKGKNKPSEKQKAVQQSTQVFVIFPPKSPCRVPCKPEHCCHGDCCGECTGGSGGGPCYQPPGCRRPPCCDGRCCGKPICDCPNICSCSRCRYFCQENPSACRIM